MKCIILQPSYIPWRGYFHQIYLADTFVFYDDVQYDKRGWRNRNKIKTPHGLQWLSIPVHSKGSQKNNTPINQIRIVNDQDWAQDQLETLKMAYSKAPFFEPVFEEIRPLYLQHFEFLADFTIALTIKLSSILGIDNTKFIRSSELDQITGTKTDRLISILNTLGADHYISGPSARDYIENDKFEQCNIKLEYMDYQYPEYDQLYPPFEPFVSILDLLFIKGNNSLDYIK